MNDASAYDLLARCYFDMNTYDKALGVVDHGISIFKTDLNLHWLGARIATIGTKNFENAQQRINRLLELAPNNSIGHSEQVYLHSVSYTHLDVYKRQIIYHVMSRKSTGQTGNGKTKAWI